MGEPRIAQGLMRFYLLWYVVSLLSSFRHVNNLGAVLLNYSSFIDNQFVKTANPEALDVLNPANGETIAVLDKLSANQIEDALSVAYQAQKKWKKLTSIERGDWLTRLADKLIDHKENIGRILALESGKSFEDATNETIYAAEVTRYHAGWARRIEGEVIPSDSPDENLVLHREPMGVVACLIPFNYPVYTLLRKIAPALITGNSVIVRPSSSTPCSAMEIAKAIADCEFPKGVINILIMDHDVAEQICTDSRISMMTLTGSVYAGRQILEYSKTNIAKCSLELGGKTPAIVASDADLENAAKLIVMSKTTNCGQLCTAIERVYVHDSIYTQFVELLRSNLSQIQIGDRSINPAFMGPLISKKSRDNIHQIVLKAVEQGSTVILGGDIPNLDGFFYPPTLIVDCHQKMDIIQEEIFGPILPVVKYSEISQALEMANDNQYGLASVIFSENYRTIMTFANHIEAGELYVNRTPADPYQGYHAGWKRSGLGGDDGKHGMLEFTQTRLVIMKY